MAAGKGFVLGPDEGLGGMRMFLGQPMRMLADGNATGDAFTLFEQEEKQGFAMPLHIHRIENEAFSVPDGRLLVAWLARSWPNRATRWANKTATRAPRASAVFT